jgi:hypothetical protein
VRKSLIIGVSGVAGSGKDTFASVYKERDEKTVFIVALADPIKRTAKMIFPEIPDDYLWGPSENREFPTAYLDGSGKPLTARKILQRMGTDFARDLCPDTWLLHMKKAVSRLESDDWTVYDKKVGVVTFTRTERNHAPTIIIPDVRFQNEVDWIRSRGGVIVSLILPDDKPCSDNHASEHADPSWGDFQIVNFKNGLEIFYDTADQIRKMGVI